MVPGTILWVDLVRELALPHSATPNLPSALENSMEARCWLSSGLCSSPSSDHTRHCS